MSSRHAAPWMGLLGALLAGPAWSAPRPATDAEAAAARAHLEAVLLRREFQSGRQTQGFFYRLLQVVARGLGRLFSFFRGHGSHHVWGIPLEWVAMAAIVTAAAIILGILLRTALRQSRSRAERAPLIDPPAGALRRLRQPAEWLAAAQESARRGDFLQAVRCTFLALLGQLEAGPEALTNWEVLRRLEGDARAPALEAATRLYESHWYAGRPAGPADYEELLRLYRAVEAGA